MPDSTTIIVGAGLSGITAAVILARQGENCLLVEKNHVLGGMSRSLKMDGITFDMGPHVIFPESGKAGELITESLHGVETISNHFAFAIYDGVKFWKFPNMSEVAFYPWKFKFDLFRSLIKRNKGNSKSLEAEIKSKTGPLLYELLFKNTLRKKCGKSPSEIHKHWLMRPDRTAFNQLEPPPQLPRFRTIIKTLSKMNKKYIYPASGFGDLAENLHKLFLKAGGKTVLGCEELSLEAHKNRIISAQINGKDLPLKNIIWTAPAHSLCNALVLNHNSELTHLEFKDILLVFLTYNRQQKQNRPFVYTYHPDPKMIFNRIYYPASLYRDKTPHDREGICLEITISSDADEQEVADIGKLCIADVEKLGLYPSNYLREMKIERITDGLPIYGMDYEKQLHAAYTPLKKYENLRTVGRQGGWFFCMSPEAVSQGIKAAESLLKM